jgi:predicted neuraminidase
MMAILAQATLAAAPAALVSSEFLPESPGVPFSHASTLVETKQGLLAAWVAGTKERALDVSLYTSRLENGHWSPPFELADGRVESEQRRYPVWNPVLFQPKSGPLMLFYKVGPGPESWWALVMTSKDHGRTWSPPKKLSWGMIGPVRNKPVELPNGELLCGASTEKAGWQVHMETATPGLTAWMKSRPLNNAMEFSAIQPAIFKHRSGKIQILCRTKQGKLVESWSSNNAITWSPFKATSLPNPNGAVDGVVLLEGLAVLVYNHSSTDRNSLDVAVSSDGGEHWRSAMVLENEPGNEYSYPSVIQTSDGLVHVTYSWNRRRIKHVVLDPWKLNGR